MRDLIASSKCPFCKMDTPHSHTKRELTQQFRQQELRKIFERVAEIEWWPYLKEYCHGAYGRAPILLHKRSGFTHAQGPDDKYVWGPLQLLWEVFCYVSLFEHPTLPDDSVPEMYEALRIKRNPWVDIEYPVLLRKYHELCNESSRQRDAALKLAQSWLEALYFLPPDSAGKPYIGTAYRKCARELRAIFAPKEGK